MTSDAARSASGIQRRRRGARAPKNNRAAPTGVNARGWGINRNAMANRTNTYASMNHLGDEFLFWALETLASRDDRRRRGFFRRAASEIILHRLVLES